MFEWYWGLSGLTWFVVTMLMGGTTIGMIGLVVIGCAKSIARSFDHDPKTCDCPNCEGQRARFLNRQARASERLKKHTPVVTPGMFISTAELKQGMIIVAEKNGNVYEFNGMQRRSYGYTVIFTNLKTDARAWIVVPLPRLHVRMWKVADTGLRRVYGL